MNACYFLIFLLLTTAESRSRLYKFNITAKTNPAMRLWRPLSQSDMGGWLVRIMNGNGDFACCGSYIAPLIVITSGNCIEPYRNNLHGASVESIARLNNNEDNFSFIETVYTPENFTEHQNYMDIAVVMLKRPIRGKLTEFIKLCDTKILNNMTMTSFGWGYSSFSLQDPSIDPRNFSVPVQSLSQCKNKWAKNRRVKISNSVFCVTHPKDDRRQCVYDPGCPLVYNNELCGIVSIDSTCVDPSKPGIYTNINDVKEFILQIQDDIKSGLLP